jgi:RNA polymerase sigma-70 factor (ECF subfamily)
MAREELAVTQEDRAMGDEATEAREFERRFAQHRGELRLHCYRMVGSFDEAEDLVQETFLRAWRHRDSFEGRSAWRTWLYRIATNASLDALRRRPRRPVIHVGAPGEQPFSEVSWLQPMPDVLVDEAEGPDALAVATETIELAYLVAIQHLSPLQRAVVVLRDVLGWRAAETAEALETSTAAVNSALQRGRAALRAHQRGAARDEMDATAASAVERDIVRRYVDAHVASDAQALVDMLRADVRFWMPPTPEHWMGRDAVAAVLHEIFDADTTGDFRMVPTRANRQPAGAAYLRKPGGNAFEALALDVLRIEDGLIVEIVTFGPEVFPRFGLPPVYDPAL